MRLSISNIAWTKERDQATYQLMRENGYTGLEIAPTRILEEKPYDRLTEASEWSIQLKEEMGFIISSMQSIWYGRNEALFGSVEDKKALFDYTKKAIDFAKAVGCGNLVFGSPRNRNLPDGADAASANSFFKELGDYAFDCGTVLAMEANPTIYNTNYINTTEEAIDLITRVDSQGFKLNLDLGTMIQNGEAASCLEGHVDMINHVHISEPGLKPIEAREIHHEIKKLLEKEKYQGFISIEMGRVEQLELLDEKMSYVKDIFLK